MAAVAGNWGPDKAEAWCLGYGRPIKILGSHRADQNNNLSQCKQGNFAFEWYLLFLVIDVTTDKVPVIEIPSWDMMVHCIALRFDSLLPCYVRNTYPRRWDVGSRSGRAPGYLHVRLLDQMGRTYHITASFGVMHAVLGRFADSECRTSPREWAKARAKALGRGHLDLRQKYRM